jgi:hypothetical protein
MAGQTTFGISGSWGITLRYVLVGSNAITLPGWIIDPTSYIGVDQKQPAIVRFYAGNNALPGMKLQGSTSGASNAFTILQTVVDSGSLTSGANATGWFLVDKATTLSMTETLQVGATTYANAASNGITMPVMRGMAAKAVSIMPEGATIRVTADGSPAGSNANTPSNFGLPIAAGTLFQLQEWTAMTRLIIINDAASANATVNVAIYY